MASEIIVEIEDNLMIVTLNRPQARNAGTYIMAEEVAEAMAELDGNPSLTAAIITGAGGSFCAGQDLKHLGEGKPPAIYKDQGFLGIAEKPPLKPLIAAIEGFAVGGGCELALACDLIVAAENVKFGMPEVKRGLMAAGGGLFRLPRQIPSRVAMEMGLTGDPVLAPRAYELGLINRVAKKGEALSAAKALAARITANGPLAVKESKRIMVESKDWTLQEEWDKNREIYEPVFKTADAKEGIQAFIEKRDPVWTGK